VTQKQAANLFFEVLNLVEGAAPQHFALPGPAPTA